MDNEWMNERMNELIISSFICFLILQFLREAY